MGDIVKGVKATGKFYRLAGRQFLGAVRETPAIIKTGVLGPNMHSLLNMSTSVLGGPNTPAARLGTSIGTSLAKKMTGSNDTGI